MYAAHVLSLPEACAHAGFLVAAGSAGAAAAEPSGFLQAWLALVVTVAALTEAQGRLARPLRSGEPLSVAILDLDDFKKVNDRDGHGAGDALLRALTAGWAHRLRHADLLGRYGGDEFVLCLPATDEQGAHELLDRLEETHAFRWSVGLATVRPGDTLAGVLARADEGLYLRKRAGRRTA